VHYRDTLFWTPESPPFSCKCAEFNPFPKKIEAASPKFFSKRVKPYTYRIRGAMLISRTELKGSLTLETHYATDDKVGLSKIKICSEL